MMCTLFLSLSFMKLPVILENHLLTTSLGCLSATSPLKIKVYVGNFK